MHELENEELALIICVSDSCLFGKAISMDKPLHDGRLGRIRPSELRKAAVFIGRSSEKPRAGRPGCVEGIVREEVVLARR